MKALNNYLGKKRDHSRGIDSKHAHRNCGLAVSSSTPNAKLFWGSNKYYPLRTLRLVSR